MNNAFSRLSCLVMLVMLGSTAAATADEVTATVVLNNGDVLSGPVEARTDESITLTHPLLGSIELSMSNVRSITEASPTVEPQAVAEAATRAATTVASGGADPTVTPPSAPAAEPEIEDVRPGLFGTNFLRGWTKTAQLGFSGTEGNTRTTSINAGANLFFEDDRHRWDFATRYNLKSDRGENTTNHFFAQLQKDWLIPDSKWFYFAQGRFDYDEFQSWDTRLSGAAGVGYQFVKNEDWELRGKAGLGLTKEFGSSENRIVPDAVAGLAGSWNVTDNQKLVFSTEAYKGLLEADQFRTLSAVEYIISVDRKYGLNLKFGVEHEYNNVVDEGRDRNDLTYYGALMMEF